jgi:mono/diheme cytochrome c family protein
MRSLGLLAIGSLLLTPPAYAAGPSTAKLGQKIDTFAFTPDAAARASDFQQTFKGKQAVVVVFLSFECPVSNSYSPHLTELFKACGDRVGFLGVCPCDLNAKQLAEQVQQFKLPFPVYLDADHAIAGRFEATITPEAFLLDGDFVLRYRGRIDDTWAGRLKKNQQTTERDLKRALDELVAGKKVSQPATTAIGCPIPLDQPKVATGKVTYHRDVLPILQNRCQSCHRPGEVGPFALLTYRQAVNWAPDIKEYTQSRQMPPWKPTDGPRFRDERKLTDSELATIAAWVDGGTPEGDPKDAPPPRKFTDGWQLGKPDLVLEVPADFQVGASGNDLFRCFVLPTNLPEDKDVVAVEVRPGNPRVVHHALLFIDSTGQGRKLEMEEKDKKRPPDAPDAGPGYSVSMGVGFVPQGGLGGWAPGQVARHLPEGTGYHLPKGADVIIQVHYHRTGRVEKDRTQVGLYLAPRPVAKRYQGTAIPGRFLFIPAGNASYKVTGTIWLDRDCDLYSIMPHMHMLGKSINVTMTPPEGQAQTLIAIKEWDYGWQESYFFEKPVRVKSGTRFDVEAIYDNSAANPHNPNRPPRIVKFGQQTTDEMCFVFLGGTSDQPGRIRPRLQPTK